MMTKIKKPFGTKIKALNPLHPEWGILTWSGPKVYAYTKEDAQKYCEEHLGYCEVTDEFVGSMIDDNFIEAPQNPNDDNFDNNNR